MAKKTDTVHKCATCKGEFPGTGKRGRPHKNCPKCRKQK